jgi:hypothetical protein
MLGGQEFLASIDKSTGPTRENAILAQLYAGNVPSFLKKENFVPIVLSDGGRKLIVRVSPDVVSVGTDSDFVRMPLWPSSAQMYANFIDSILPSRKLSKDIHQVATTKIAPQARTPDSTMESSLAFGAHQQTIQKQLQSVKHDASQILSGHKKDVVVGPNLDGKKVAIYGWHSADGVPIQPYSTIHAAEYSDYSHGIRLIDRSARLDGEKVDLIDIFTDPKTAALVSDQGPFLPLFPNIGPSAPRPSEYKKAVFSDAVSGSVSLLSSAMPALVTVGLVVATLSLTGGRSR